MKIKSVKTTSTTGTLNYLDFAKGLIMAVLGAVIQMVYEIAFQGGFEAIDWADVAKFAGLTSLAYLIKNLFTPGEVIVTPEKEEAVKLIKESTATVSVSTDAGTQATFTKPPAQ